jgi:TonB family protein
MVPGKLPSATLFALLALLGTSAAAGQTPAPEAAPPSGEAPVAPEALHTVTRPVPVNAPAPLYPRGQSGEHAVAVELTVTKEGAVSDATILLGEPPFTDLALDAVRAWTFEPARRNGQPIAARIRFEILFHEPRPEPEPEAPPPGSEGSKPPPPPPDAPVDVTVVGVREAPERVSMSRAEVREMPGTFGDPFRAVEVMPGVTPLATGLPYFYVRGAPPGNVGYYLDNIRLPLLYHFALGPSVIHPGIIERVDLYSGAYPARYGRFSGGIVAAETTPPKLTFHGEANVRLFDAGALVEAPVADGRGVVLAAGRYSYTGGILSLIAPEVTLGYWDYQLRGSYEVTERDRLGVFAFGSYDFFAVEDSGREDGLGTEFHRIDLRHERRIDARTDLKSAVTLGYDRTGQDTLDEDAVSVLDLSIGARTRLEHRGSEQALYRGGLDLNFDDYSTALDDEEAEQDFPTRTDYALGAFAEVVWAPERWMQITPGLRVDWYGSGNSNAVGIDPRISARYQISRRVALKNALGIAHQPPSFVVPVPGFALGGLEDGLQRAFQSSAGVDVAIGGDVHAEATVFQNVFFNLSDLLSLVQSGELDDDVDLETRLRGQSYGLEIMVRRPLTEKLGGYFAYTLSRSLRSLRGHRFTASFDRTHVLHAALAYDLGRRWRAGTRFTFYTGVPAEVEYTLTVDPMGQPTFATDVDRGIRAPSFYRLDVRLEKKWPIGTKGAWWSFIFEIINTTLHKETLSYRCTEAGCRGDEFGPVTIPSIGVEAAF